MKLRDVYNANNYVYNDHDRGSHWHLKIFQHIVNKYTCNTSAKLMTLKKCNSKWILDGDNEYENIYTLYVYVKVVVHEFSCDSLLSRLTKWNVHRRKKVWQQFDRTIAHNFTNLWGCTF